MFDIVFFVIVDEQGSHRFDLLCEAPNLQPYLRHAINEYNVLYVLDHLLHDLRNTKHIEHEGSFYTGSNNLTLRIGQEVVALKNDLDPKEVCVSMKRIDCIDFFEEWRIFLVKYYNAEIPGLIPVNRIDNWITAPKEFVKEEYLDSL